jgi:hypothetical protein
VIEESPPVMVGSPCVREDATLEVESTEIIEVESTEIIEVESTEIVEVESTEIVEVESTEIVEVEVVPSNTENFEWRIVYRDGSELYEYAGGDCHNADAQHEGAHVSACVTLDESVQGIALIPQREGLPYVAVVLPDGARPIIFRRRPVYDVLNGGHGVALPEDSITVIGWQRTIAGENVKYMIAVPPDGSIAAADDEKLF